MAAVPSGYRNDLALVQTAPKHPEGVTVNLSAISIGLKSTTQQAAEDIARRNSSAGHGRLLFRDTGPIIEAVAKALAADPVKPVAPAAASGPADLAAEMKAIIAPALAAVERATASISQPKAVPPTAVVAPAQRSSGNHPSVPILTETQHRRFAENREEARKAAARDEADRVIVQKSGPRVLTFRKLDATLTDAALAGLAYIVSEWESAGRRPVRLYAADLARGLDIPLASAQAAYTELSDKHLVISAKDSLGVLKVQPGLGVTGS